MVENGMCYYEVEDGNDEVVIWYISFSRTEVGFYGKVDVRQSFFKEKFSSIQYVQMNTNHPNQWLIFEGLQLSRSYLLRSSRFIDFIVVPCSWKSGQIRLDSF